MKYERKDYKKDPPVINITKATTDILLEQDKPGPLMALYYFYCYTAAWQCTLQPRATVRYVAEGLKWSKGKVQQVKKQLVGLGLIEDIQKRKDDASGKFGKQYVRVHYFTVGTKNLPTVEPIHKCLVTGSKKCLVTNSRHLKDGDRKTIPSLFDGKASTKLYKIIKSHKNITYNTTKWPDIFRRLRQVNKVSSPRIKEVIIWYSKHIGEEYVPVVESAKSFRDKFTRLEDAMIRYNKKYYPEDEEAQEDKYDEHGHMIDNFY